MIKKIEEPGDFSEVERGTVLLKYPLTGEFAVEVDFTDNSNLLHYEIEKINNEVQMLALKVQGSQITLSETSTGSTRFTDVDDSHLLHKSFEELIIEKIWWMEK
jgi:hypothetical protein